MDIGIIEKRVDKLESNIDTIKDDLRDIDRRLDVDDEKCKGCRDTNTSRIEMLTTNLTNLTNRINDLSININKTKDNQISSDKNISIMTKEVTELVSFRNQMNYKFWKVIFIIITAMVGIVFTYLYNVHIKVQEANQQQFLDQRIELLIEKIEQSNTRIP